MIINQSHMPTKTNSSPSSGAGVNAQYALHIWDSQEESHPNQGWISYTFLTSREFSFFFILYHQRDPSSSYVALKYSSTKSSCLNLRHQVPTMKSSIACGHHLSLRPTMLWTPRKEDLSREAQGLGGMLGRGAIWWLPTSRDLTRRGGRKTFEMWHKEAKISEVGQSERRRDIYNNWKVLEYQWGAGLCQSS